MSKIIKELARIQRELKAPKNLYNSYGKYAYRNAEGILEAVKPLLNGLALIINDEPVLIGDRYYIKATVTLTDGEETVSAVAYAREDELKKGMDGCQLTGSCSSYARKYALNALLMIDDSKDSDDDSQSPKNPKNAEEEKPKEEKPTPQRKNDNHAQVTKTATIPQGNPVFDYLANERAYMGQRLGITDPKLLKVKFKTLWDGLVASGAVENVDPNEMSMEQAKALVSAMYATLTTAGELK